MRILVVLLCALSIFACKQEAKVEAQFMDKKQNDSAKSLEVTPIPLQKVMGKFSPQDDHSFVPIEAMYADREGMFLHTEAYEAFKKMWAHAQRDGVSLIIRSATRNFDYQRGIWERKWTGATKVSGQDLSQAITNPKDRALKILNYSSMPGTSRHHWGTDVDFNAFENTYFESGEGLKVYTWLLKNATSYGFFRPYTAKGEARPHGYQEEKWHWSYEPLASQYMLTANAKLQDDLITGFSGSETATEIEVVDKYVKGVSTFDEQK